MVKGGGVKPERGHHVNYSLKGGGGGGGGGGGAR